MLENNRPSDCALWFTRPQILVVALPRGGVPVAYEIAQLLQVPLDICLVRKLGVPGQAELAMGAIATGGIRVLNPSIIAGFGHYGPDDRGRRCQGTTGIGAARSGLSWFSAPFRRHGSHGNSGG